MPTWLSAINLAKTVSDALKDARTIGGKAKTMAGQTSLIDVSQAARVEPLMIVDEDVMDLEYLPDLSWAMHSLFSGYYLMAVEAITNIGGIKVGEKLAPLNPNRPILDYGMESLCFSRESYAFDLPTKAKAQKRLAMESEDSRQTDKKKQSFKPSEPAKASDLNKAISDGASLSVGKLFNVTLREDTQTAVINVAIRLLAATMPSSVVTNIFSLNNVMDNEIVHRWHSWRAGQISFWKDLVFCNDLIKKSRNTAIKDKTGIYSEMLERQNKTLGLALVDQEPTLAQASNLAIISSDTMEAIEYKMLGSIKHSSKVRDAIFDTTNMMILAVVDKGYERVDFYHRGISRPSEMNIREVKAAAKSGGDEVSKILAAFIGGKTP